MLSWLPLYLDVMYIYIQVHCLLMGSVPENLTYKHPTHKAEVEKHYNSNYGIHVDSVALVRNCAIMHKS